MIFQKIRQQNPIIHCITNIVSANFQANGLLAIGASPIMSESIDESKEIESKVQALSLNIGTLNNHSMELMKTAGQAANKNNVPIVLDPVGAGFTKYRTACTQELLQSFKIQAIRCNLGEFAALANIKWESKGVDAGKGDIEEIKEKIKNFAHQNDCIIAVTGQEDLVASPSQTKWVKGGNILITQITASGCLLSSICAAALSVADSNLNTFDAIIETLTAYKRAACQAYQQTKLIGQFQLEFLNSLYQQSLETLHP